MGGHKYGGGKILLNTQIWSDLNSVRRTPTFTKLLSVSRWTYFTPEIRSRFKKTKTNFPFKIWLKTVFFDKASSGSGNSVTSLYAAIGPDCRGTCFFQIQWTWLVKTLKILYLFQLWTCNCLIKMKNEIWFCVFLYAGDMTLAKESAANIWTTGWSHIFKFLKVLKSWSSCNTELRSHACFRQTCFFFLQNTCQNRIRLHLMQ